MSEAPSHWQIRGLYLTRSVTAPRGSIHDFSKKAFNGSSIFLRSCLRWSRSSRRCALWSVTESHTAGASYHPDSRHCQVVGCDGDGLPVEIFGEEPVEGCRVVVAVKCHRYPTEIINHCVWLHHRFPLNFREGKEMMRIRTPLANGLYRHRPHPRDRWHLNEMFTGKNHYMWRAVDQVGTWTPGSGPPRTPLHPRHQSTWHAAGQPPAQLRRRVCG